MEPPLDIAFLLVMVGIVALAISFLSGVAHLIPNLLKLFSFIATKVHEYQSLDRGCFLTLLIDAGLSHEQAYWFYETFYSDSTCWERCLIKFFINKHCF